MVRRAFIDKQLVSQSDNVARSPARLNAKHQQQQQRKLYVQLQRRLRLLYFFGFTILRARQLSPTTTTKLRSKQGG